jgi:hypothetical protein
VTFKPPPPPPNLRPGAADPRLRNIVVSPQSERAAQAKAKIARALDQEWSSYLNEPSGRTRRAIKDYEQRIRKAIAAIFEDAS